MPAATTRKRASKKTTSIDESGAESAVEPVVLQLSISKKRVDQLLKAEENKTVQHPDPVPYTPDLQFSSAFASQDAAPPSTLHTNGAEGSLATAYPRICSHHDLTCYWCCHKITHLEHGMPIRYDIFHNSFSVFGSFCSLECAAAYNFSVHSGCDRVWEIHSWIQLLGQMYGYNLPIRPAPSRYLLKMFNGPLSIEEFRECHKTLTHTYTANIPPLIHITNSMECVNTSFLDKDPVKRTEPRKRSEQKMNLFVVEEA